jgi:thiol-disulfide isomerase/thioredoxin
MISAYRDGDKALAQSYADQFVRYQQNFFFEVREIIDLIGEALVRQQVINDDDWVGVGQYVDYELAKTRYELGSILKPTHDMAMKRIKPDPKQQAEIFYFFTLNCSWCRYGAPDIERLYRLAKKDPRVKFTALTVGSTNVDWLEEYKKYHEWSMPVYDGSELAKKWNIGFVPVVVIVSPNGDKAYMKSGQQSFERLYEFMRTVQGLPVTVTPQFKQIASTPIGAAEKSGKNLKIASSNKRKNKKLQVAAPPKKRRVEIQRF